MNNFVNDSLFDNINACRTLIRQKKILNALFGSTMSQLFTFITYTSEVICNKKKTLLLTDECQ